MNAAQLHMAGDRIDEQSKLAEVEVKPLRAQLCELARKEFALVLAVTRLERANRAAGHAQIALDYLLIAARLPARDQFSDAGDPFSSLMNELEDHMEQHDRLIVSSIPAEPMWQIAGYLLADTKITPARPRRQHGSPRPPAPQVLRRGAPHCRCDEDQEVRTGDRSRSCPITTRN